MKSAVKLEAVVMEWGRRNVRVTRQQALQLMNPSPLISASNVTLKAHHFRADRYRR